MFKKRICKKCSKKIKGTYDFCPYCGISINKDEENWGMLGKNDSISEEKLLENELFGGFGGKMLSKMLGNAMKMLEKEIQKEMRNQNPSKTNFELFINGKRVNPKNIRITNQLPKAQKQKEVSLNNLSNENFSKFSKLPKNEPKTNIRRLSNKVIYEIDMPEVKSIKDVSIIKLENSIEIKAISKDKSYFKLIPLNLPIINYSLSEGKLTLELGIQ